MCVFKTIPYVLTNMYFFNRCRIKRTPEEKAFIEKQLEIFFALPKEEQKGGQWAFCLQQIEESPADTKALFHPWHVTDSTKIRTAVRTK